MLCFQLHKSMNLQITSKVSHIVWNQSVKGVLNDALNASEQFVQPKVKANKSKVV